MENNEVSHGSMSRTRRNYYLNGIKYGLIISASLSIFGAVLILLISLCNIDGTKAEKMCAYIIAVLFWATIIALVILTVKITKYRNYLQERGYRIRGIRHSPIGVFSFFKNKEAAVIDIVLFISAVSVGIISWTHISLSLVILFSISLLFFSFNMHCILNGRNYRYYKAFIKYQKEQE